MVSVEDPPEPATVMTCEPAVAEYAEIASVQTVAPPLIELRTRVDVPGTSVET